MKSAIGPCTILLINEVRPRDSDELSGPVCIPTQLC